MPDQRYIEFTDRIVAGGTGSSRERAMTTFEQTLRKDNHTRHFEVLLDDQGWRVVTCADSLVVRETIYTDWHRVERARRAFAIEARSLKLEGWH